MKKLSLFLSLSIMFTALFAQQPRDAAEYREARGGYFVTTILPDVNATGNVEPLPAVKSFKVDVSKIKYPNDPALYTQVWHNTPVSQGNTGTCWCFSTTSFFESEVYKSSGTQVKLSEMFVVYWQYVERAKYFVEHRGEMTFGEGSETNGTTEMIKKYGAMPYDAYNGKTGTAGFYNHEKMFAEMDNYLKNVKVTNNWNSSEVESTIKSILNFYMGEPPAEFSYLNKKYSPQDFLKNVLKLDMNKYVDFMSLMSQPFYAQVEYDVPDNWWNDKSYYNLPAEDFMEALKMALKNGYSVSIGGDVSEVGWDAWNNLGIIPTFDCPSEYIDDAARQLRFANGATTDDHAMHLVGYSEMDGKTWFLYKDSGSGSRNCGPASKNFGYMYVSEDYVKLKMMTFTVNKDAVKNFMDKFAMNR